MNKIKKRIIKYQNNPHTNKIRCEKCNEILMPSIMENELRLVCNNCNIDTKLFGDQLEVFKLDWFEKYY